MPHPLFDPRLAPYLDSLVPERPEEMQRMEEYAHQHDFPMIGPAAGYFCYLVARMIGARSVFELGSGYGYSTAWFCKAVEENGGGTVQHVVWDEELSRMAKEHLGALGYGDMVRFTVSEAVEALEKEPGPFDLIFNDIDKEGYPGSLPAIERKLRKGGVLLTDNLLWFGRIFDPQDQSPQTNGVRELTRLTTTSPDWAATIIPIRDGVLLAVRQ